MRRKRTFLADHDWQTIPWEKNEKTSRDRLLDTAANVPSLLEELDHFCGLPSPKGFNNLLQSLLYVDEGLTLWFETEAPISHLEDLQARGFDSATRGDFAVVEVMNIYWAMCILTYSGLQIVINLSPDLAKSSPTVGRLTNLPRSNPRQYCTQIANTAGIFFQPSAGAMFAKSTAFPIGVSLGFFMATEGLSSREAEVLLGYFTKGNQGKAMGAFIKGSVEEWGPDFPKSEEGRQSIAKGRFSAV